MPTICLDKTKEVLSEFDKYQDDSLKLYRDLQTSKITLSDRMEELDPSPVDENGNNTSPVDAFERHLLALEISLSGPKQFSVEKLFGQVEYLMPELILRTIKKGMEVAEKFMYKDCVALTVPSSSATYHPLYIPEQDLATVRERRAKSMGKRSRSGKGGEFPVLSVVQREKTIALKDNGLTIETSYNVIKDSGFADFGILLQLVGAQFAADKLQNIYDLAITGDGTVGAATDTFNGAAGTLAYSDLVRNSILFNPPFVMDRILAPQKSLETILTMAQFQDPLSNFEYQQSGKMVTPMGAKLKQVNPTPGSVPVGTIVATMDSRYAVKEVVNSPLMVEAEKIINRKFERAVVSEATRFCIIADGAIKRIVWT